MKPIPFPSLPLLLIFCLPLWSKLVAMEMRLLAHPVQPATLSQTQDAPWHCSHPPPACLPCSNNPGVCKMEGTASNRSDPNPSVQVIPLQIFQPLVRALGITGNPAPPSQGPSS